jgi:hypothetical protein
MPFLFNKVSHIRCAVKAVVVDTDDVQYGAAIRLRCKFAAEAAQVAAMIKENALKQRALERPTATDEKDHHGSDDERTLKESA